MESSQNELTLQEQELRKGHRVLRELLNPVSCSILACLHRRGRACALDIYEELSSRQSDTSRHLNDLQRQGIVQSSREGHRIFYTINYAKVVGVHQRVGEVLQGGAAGPRKTEKDVLSSPLPSPLQTDPKTIHLPEAKTLKTYPYQHLELEDLGGEQWKDIPGLEGYFAISSLGRLKRLPCVMQDCNGTVYRKLEKIIKPSVSKAPNHYTGDHTSLLWVRVIRNGWKYNMTLARMMYYCFVQPFDLEDHTKVILCRDGDNLNIRPGNLVLASLEQKQQRIAERGRRRSPLLDRDDQAGRGSRKA